MNEDRKTDPNQEYIIIFQGHLDQRWARQFDQMLLTRLPGGETQLTGTVSDQAALHGLLSRIRDLGLPLLLVKRGDFHWEAPEYSQRKN